MGSAVRNRGGMVPAIEGALGGMGPHIYTLMATQQREHGVHTTEAAPRMPCAGQAWEVGGMECWWWSAVEAVERPARGNTFAATDWLKPHQLSPKLEHTFKLASARPFSLQTPPDRPPADPQLAS
jgi:hypothetical protein